MDSGDGTAFGQQLLLRAREDPERPALTSGEVSLSRAELVARAQRLARRFAELGVERGSFVTIVLPNSVEFVESMLAAWWLGATPQPISSRAPVAERSAIIDLANPALAVGVPAHEAGGRPTISAEEVRAATERVVVDQPELKPLVAPAWKVLGSGGSTGRPKLIVAESPALVEVAVAPFGSLLRFPSDGSVLVTGPLSHNAPFVVAIVGLLLGNHVVVMPRFDPSETLRLVELHRTQWLYLVPTMMLRIWRLPERERLARDLSSLQIAFHMAAPCPQWLKQEWIEWLGPETVLELYGGTELQALTVVTGTEWLAHRGTVGRPVIGEVEVRDPAGVVLAPGAPGELWLRRGAGEPPAYRYIGATARSAPDGWESLGDMGYVDEEGYVYLTDRQTDMILVGGENVYPAEVEAALDEHPAVRSCCVIGLPHEDLGSAPHAIVELAKPVGDAEIFAHLRQRLAPAKVPRTIERVDHPLRDDAGKVRRPALREARIAPATDTGAPTTGV
jgi:bile acid-coenzyme A ligase